MRPNEKKSWVSGKARSTGDSVAFPGVARPVATQQKRNNKKLNIIDMNKKNLFLLILSRPDFG